jgi:hypothetical protein
MLMYMCVCMGVTQVVGLEAHARHAPQLQLLLQLELLLLLLLLATAHHAHPPHLIHERQLRRVPAPTYTRLSDGCPHIHTP